MEHKCLYCGAPLPEGAFFCHCCARSQGQKRLFLPPRRHRRIRWPQWAAAAAALLAIACVPILRSQAAPSDSLPTGQPTTLPEATASTALQTVPIPETTVPEESLTQLQELALNAIEEALATPDLEAHTPQLVNAIEYRAGNWDGKRSTFHGLLLRQKVEINAYFCQRQRVAQRDQLAGALGGHDARNARHAQHITLGHTAGSNFFIYFSAYADFSLRHGNPRGVSLIADIHHQSITRSVKMCKFTHCLLLQSLYLSANLAHIKARCFYIKAVSRRLGVNNLLHRLQQIRITAAIT